MLDLVSLKLFVECINTGSLTRVSKEQHIALAALSRRINLLEDHYGVQLLERTGRGVSATDAGHTLYKKAHDIFEQVHLAQADVSDYSHGKKGSVSIIASTSAITYELPKQLNSFNQDHPDIRVEIAEAFTTEVINSIRSHHHELGIIVNTNYIEDLVTLPYYKDELVIITSKDIHFNSPSINFGQITCFDFVLMDGSTAISKLLSSSAAKVGQIIRVRVRVGSFETVCRMVEAGFGIGVIPKKIAMQFTQTMELNFYSIDEEWSTREILICYNKSRPLSLAAQKLLRHLQYSPS
ncbi:LysR family transcriptional regulator [Acinetobacter stercoris]|uniref:HTH-type transcriptional activator CmpR n=1 Tax=Acinetobacter stercoris TaxID=2126983 RepID=A0A2U3N401_9GAMM|nr:LysR family transcriptional regulator [Acinetobacter stercoris]SPL72354.1 HTH-type transcriptional activator CmpR [Acinetobacter stercoris]